MLQNKAYTINPEKSKEFFEMLSRSAPSKSDWKRIKKEAQVLDKKRLDALFERRNSK
ncbi:hypothetical protein SAMN04487770_12227 [Butyrivibrio sp. ob235]|uniref:hypothetical protein n=1 Tax=Butyrivibrio sp. ob235 TaxID=1761780 RepID=UPI0008D5E8EE|nr:hypothetical protein [Butyrivibrio sp. ob235]SEL96952.1 hypothetical protein SAMN04487770_12227 [Butyrivibrio sp. ob235]